MIVAIGSDHAGFALKERFKSELAGAGHSVVDVGTDSEQSCDYPDFALPVARLVRDGDADRGVLVCGTGVGMSMVANKVTGIRAALCNDITCARMSRAHNDANVMTIGSRIVQADDAVPILQAFLETAFEGDGDSGARHTRRLQKLAEVERGCQRGD